MSTRGNWQDVEAVAESVLEKHRAFLQPQLAKILSQIQQVGRETDMKLTASQAELTALTATLGSTRDTRC